MFNYMLPEEVRTISLICRTFLFVFSTMSCNSMYTHGAMHNTNMEMNEQSVQTISNPDWVLGSRKEVWFIVMYLTKTIVGICVGCMTYMF